MTIYDELLAHNKKEKASFHMPGHKNGVGFRGRPLRSALFSFDTTELADTDALIEPTGSILQAEKMAASIYGAGHSLFLVNGATCGILAMFYANFYPGDVVLVDRNCHRSVIHALALCGAEPIYLLPKPSKMPGVPGVLSAEKVAEQFEKNPHIKGVFLTSPNYYGAAADVKKIAQIAHENGALLLVDEAHGAHFPFSDAFPKTAMEQGADLSVVSLHKTLCSPNQTALLHIAKGREVEPVRETVRVFQTSSPSFIFLAAMEDALKAACESGAKQTEWVLSQLGDLPFLDDPFKRLLLYTEKGYSGFEVDEILRTRFGIYSELCDAQLVLTMSAWANEKKDFKRLKKAVSYLDKLPRKLVEPACWDISLPQAMKPQMTPGEVRNKKTEAVPLKQAQGRICAKTISAFPPCIPVVLPGETILEEQIVTLCKLRENGARIVGLFEENVTVVCEEN